MRAHIAECKDIDFSKINVPSFSEGSQVVHLDCRETVARTEPIRLANRAPTIINHEIKTSENWHQSQPEQYFRFLLPTNSAGQHTDLYHYMTKANNWATSETTKQKLFGDKAHLYEYGPSLGTCQRDSDGSVIPFCRLDFDSVLVDHKWQNRTQLFELKDQTKSKIDRRYIYSMQDILNGTSDIQIILACTKIWRSNEFDEERESFYNYKYGIKFTIISFMYEKRDNNFMFNQSLSSNTMSAIKQKYPIQNLYNLDETECCVCTELIINRVALISCGHTNTCKTCINALKSNKCPVCATVFTKIIDVFYEKLV